MSADAAVMLAWRGSNGEDRFRLALGEWRQLQAACNAGLATIYERLGTGAWYVDDFRETIRLGLIGGGATPALALEKVKAFVDTAPMMESVMLARIILGAAMAGATDDPVGKPAAEEKQTGATAAFASPPSMDPAP